MERIPNQDAFLKGHAAFLRFMAEKADGEPFRGFDHPYFVKSEIAYKLHALTEGLKVLRLERWDSWKRTTGRILEATRRACAPAISGNLLAHRFGPRGNSDSPLHLVSGSRAIHELEAQLNTFFRGGSVAPKAFGQRFEAFAIYLRDRRLGCKWRFLAYLAFLLEPRVYFPIVPEQFDRLLLFYGLETQLSSRVQWQAYATLLNLAQILKEELSIYGTPRALDIQSYMWVVGLLLEREGAVQPEVTAEVDVEAVLEERQRRANERERIGLTGELFVLNARRHALISANRPDLASRTQLVSVLAGSKGFDVLSYDVAGKELHIEVKATLSNRDADQGFWLTDSEVYCARRDESWRLYRVWSIDAEPEYRDLGNIVVHQEAEWIIEPSSFFCRMRGSFA